MRKYIYLSFALLGSCAAIAELTFSPLNVGSITKVEGGGIESNEVDRMIRAYDANVTTPKINVVSDSVSEKRGLGDMNVYELDTLIPKGKYGDWTFALEYSEPVYVSQNSEGRERVYYARMDSLWYYESSDGDYAYYGPTGADATELKFRNGTVVREFVRKSSGKRSIGTIATIEDGGVKISTIRPTYDGGESPLKIFNEEVWADFRPTIVKIGEVAQGGDPNELIVYGVNGEFSKDSGRIRLYRHDYSVRPYLNHCLVLDHTGTHDETLTERILRDAAAITNNLREVIRAIVADEMNKANAK